MERLAVYTSIDGKIITKVIKPNNLEEYILAIPHGRVKLHKHTIFCTYNSMYSDVWVEQCREHLLRLPNIIDMAFALHCEDIIHESYIGV